MIGIVLVTHGRLGHELIESTRLIVGPVLNVASVAVDLLDPGDDVTDRVEEAIAEVDGGEGVLVLTDLFGGTPSNVSLSFLWRDDIEVLTGVNLPMLLRVATTPREERPLHEVASELVAHGRQNIALASDILGTRGGTDPGDANGESSDA